MDPHFCVASVNPLESLNVVCQTSFKESIEKIFGDIGGGIKFTREQIRELMAMEAANPSESGYRHLIGAISRHDEVVLTLQTKEPK
jgi:hypothetical protein